MFNSTECTPSIPRNVPRQFHGTCGYYIFTYTVNSAERVQYFQRFKLQTTFVDYVDYVDKLIYNIIVKILQAPSRDKQLTTKEEK